MISFHNVSKKLGDKQIIHDLSWSLSEAQKLIVHGPNGCGKSTFCKLIVGILEPDQGTITRHPNWNKICGHMPSGADAFFPELTGRENLYFYGSLWQLENEQIDQIVLDTSFSQEFIDRPLRIYSQGMIQRLNFIRAIMISPKVLILDEPSVYLDQEFLPEMTKYLQAFQGSILVTTHHQDLIQALGFERVDWKDLYAC